MIEKFIVGVVVSLIIVGVPHFYKEGQRKRVEHIKSGKVYYGFFRMIGLYALALMSGELVLLAFLGNSGINGTMALICTVLSSIPMTFIYLYLYRKRYLKIIERYRKEDE